MARAEGSGGRMLKTTMNREAMTVEEEDRGRRAAVKADPWAWECWRCKDTDGKDTMNFWKASLCWKCDARRMRNDDEQNIRWMCPECSEEDHTIPGHLKRCPECGRGRDWTNDKWRKVKARPTHCEYWRWADQTTEEQPYGPDEYARWHREGGPLKYEEMEEEGEGEGMEDGTDDEGMTMVMRRRREKGAGAKLFEGSSNQRDAKRRKLSN